MSKKFYSIVLSASMVVMMLGAAVVPAPASAATVDELNALIASLQAQIAALSGQVGGGAAASTTFTSDLTIGSRGDQVVALQNFLEAKGYLVMPAGVAKGYFGSLTKSALAAYQAAKGITPAAGYFGPKTRAAVSAEAGSTGSNNGGSTGSTTLEGTDGSINDVSELSQYSSEEVGEGQDEVKVLGFEVEATNDGDIMLRSMKVSLDPTGDGSDDLDDYIEGVTIWMGDKEIGSADADDFSQDSNDNYTRTITLDRGVVVKADETEKFYVTVDGASRFDSSDIDQSSEWNIDVDNIRFEDGSGVVTTEDGYDLGNMDVAVNFVSFSDAADTELKFSTDSATPKEGIVNVDEDSETDGVVLLKGKIKLEGESDVVLDELPVTLTTVGGANVAAVTNSVTLILGDEEYTETVSITGATAGSVTFDNLDFDIEAGDTVEFTVEADINDIDAGTFDEGDTLTASVTGTNVDYVDAENEEGDQLADDTEKTGTVTGKAQEFRSEGIQLSFVSAERSATTGNSANDDAGLFTIRFKVKAVGETVYIASLADTVASGNANTGATVVVDKAGTATDANNMSSTIVDLTDDDLTAAGNFMIEDGEEHTFEVTTSIQLGAGGTSGQYRAALTALDWDTDDDATPDNTYTSNLDNFKTSYIVLN